MTDYLTIKGRSSATETLAAMPPFPSAATRAHNGRHSQAGHRA